MSSFELCRGRLPLAGDYDYADPLKVDPGEVVDLRESVKTSANWRVGNQELWKQQMEKALAIVGIRHVASGLLVAFGDLYLNFEMDEMGQSHGAFGFEAVHPAHQRRGLGGAILKERIRMADAAGITHLHATILPSNTIVHKYAEVGFGENGISQSLFLRVSPAYRRSRGSRS